MKRELKGTTRGGWVATKKEQEGGGARKAPTTEQPDAHFGWAVYEEEELIFHLYRPMRGGKASQWFIACIRIRKDTRGAVKDLIMTARS